LIIGVCYSQKNSYIYVNTRTRARTHTHTHTHIYIYIYQGCTSVLMMGNYRLKLCCIMTDSSVYLICILTSACILLFWYQNDIFCMNLHVILILWWSVNDWNLQWDFVLWNKVCVMVYCNQTVPWFQQTYKGIYIQGCNCKFDKLKHSESNLVSATKGENVNVCVKHLTKWGVTLPTVVRPVRFPKIVPNHT
jgi:hypothetical protein